MTFKEKDRLFTALYQSNYAALYACAYSVFRSALAGIRQNIRRTEFMLPALLLLSLGAGFISSFLSTRKEQKTYALMRTLGITHLHLFLSVTAEQLLPALTGAAAAALLLREIGTAGIYLGLYLFGCCAAVLRVLRQRPLETMREKE